MRLLLTVFSLLMMFVASPATAQEAMKLRVSKALMRIETEAGEAHFTVEVAHTPEQLSRGLMYRTDLPEGRAMIFYFGRTYFPTMWMKNTPLPLDMLFVDETCTIVSIFTNAEPFSEETITTPYPAAYVIEINAGEAHSNDIKEGDKVLPPFCRNEN